jgi:hypothetical protein
MSQECHLNTCPVGVATQDAKRARALDVPDKTERVRRYQEAAVKEAVRIMASMGLDGPAGLNPHLLIRRVDEHSTRSYAELYEWLAPGQLLADPPESWALDWERARPDTFKAAA